MYGTRGNSEPRRSVKKLLLSLRSRAVVVGPMGYAQEASSGTNQDFFLTQHQEMGSRGEEQSNSQGKSGWGVTGYLLAI